ncbi:DUF3857 domain-containing protein [Cytophaga sp. FL35]|uniref:DUF3857 domain-containing transglutaminase family protein n=1 Tax=Cytophaga sp. FL35 TaxID=1904456 RepID=UPI0016537AFF|nr:DUF3857 domain-containing protein [Cytophaga sp. FL35]MBC6998338.1 DUF3857 domain-containing protein [Cytophaga sp. FL35]
MKFSVSFVLSLFSATFLFGQVSITKEPSWVVQENYKLDNNLPENGVDGGVQLLLYTEQVHVDLEESFVKGVSKVVEYSGIQNVSTISANYDPTYQKLSFHSIKVIRNGKEINKLSQRDIQTARMETNAENFIYDGTISAFVNIPDVRLNDLVEYSYSIKGFNPIQKGKFSSSFVLNSTSFIDAISVHIFSKKPLHHQTINTSLEVSHSQSNGIHRYTWAQEDVPALMMEEQMPSWFIQNEMVIVSEYNTWSEVIDWGVNVFQIQETASGELLEIIENIKNTHTSEGKRIKAALSFVQNEVRYLGLHSGIGGYKPNAPNKVLEQRFGDCKDKSVLLVTMLNAMGIEAYPVLVNSALGKELINLPPSSKVFDHCIVKVIDGKENILWYDATLTDQGGTYDKIYMPNYRYGLVLDKQLQSLDTITSFANNLVEVFNTFTLEETNKGAELEIRSIYLEGEADFMRSILKNNNKELIEKEFLRYYTEKYGQVTALDAPVFVDDSVKNEIHLLERYQIDSIWRPSVENEGQLNLAIFPTLLTDALVLPTQLERQSPYALLHPMSRKQHVEVHIPQLLDVQPESATINSDYFYYDFSSQYDRSARKITLDYYYKNQDDHVPASDFKSYYQDMLKLDQKLGYLIFINENMWSTAGNIGFGVGKVMGIGAFALMVILGVIAIIVLIQKVNRKST